MKTELSAQLATTRGKIYYWKRQLAAGRAEAEEKILLYTGMLEALRESLAVKSKQIKKKGEIVLPPWIPPADMTVCFS